MSDESWKKDTEGVPAGIIPNAAVFLAAIREGPGWVGKELQLPAIAFMEKRAAEQLSKIDSQWESRSRQYQMAFWTGAFFGLRIAAHRYKQKLGEIAFAAGLDPATGEKPRPGS